MELALSRLRLVHRFRYVWHVELVLALDQMGIPAILEIFDFVVSFLTFEKIMR